MTEGHLPNRKGIALAWMVSAFYELKRVRGPCRASQSADTAEMALNWPVIATIVVGMGLRACYWGLSGCFSLCWSGKGRAISLPGKLL